MDCKDLRELAEKLQAAAISDDLWYDAAGNGDAEAEVEIREVQDALETAYEFLMRIAELVE
jgi:hypothetical protein